MLRVVPGRGGCLRGGRWRQVLGSGIRRVFRRRLNGGGEGDGSNPLDLSRNADGSPAVSVQTAVLGKKLVNTFPTRNPDETASPRLLSHMELSLSQQGSHRLRGRSKGVGRFVHREVVHLRKTFAHLPLRCETF